MSDKLPISDNQNVVFRLLGPNRQAGYKALKYAQQYTQAQCLIHVTRKVLKNDFPSTIAAEMAYIIRGLKVMSFKMGDGEYECFK